MQWRLRAAALCVFTVLVCVSVEESSAQTTVRPYKFGFTIDEQQHRAEKRDERGIVMGEFGFITADGIYHVTVYATDEEGKFRILAMRSYPYESHPKTIEMVVVPKAKPAIATTTTTTARTPQKTLPKFNFNTEACSGCFLKNSPPKDTPKIDIRTLSKALEAPTITGTGAGREMVKGALPVVLKDLEQAITPIKKTIATNTDLVMGTKGEIARQKHNKAQHTPITHTPKINTLPSPHTQHKTAESRSSSATIQPNDFNRKTPTPTRFTPTNTPAARIAVGQQNVAPLGIRQILPKITHAATKPVTTSTLNIPRTQTPSPTKTHTLSLDTNPKKPAAAAHVNNINVAVGNKSKNPVNNPPKTITPLTPAGVISKIAKKPTITNTAKTTTGSAQPKQTTVVPTAATQARTDAKPPSAKKTKNVVKLLSGPLSPEAPSVRTSTKPSGPSTTPNKVTLQTNENSSGANRAGGGVTGISGASAAGRNPLGGTTKTISGEPGDLYRFKYILDYNGHTETGSRNGNKEGSYYSIGDDSIERTIEYIANENGYQPRIRWRKLDAPVKATENTLKDYEFVWFKKP